MPKVRLELATPGLQTQCSSHWAIQLESYCWEGVEFIQLVYCIIIYLSFLNCDWLLIREVHWFYWTQKLLVPVEKFTVRMPKVRLELATPGLQTQCSSHWAIQLESYCWEGVEFIQLVYCIIIYLSFLNCDWLLIREVHWFYWTQKLLVPVEKFTVRMPKVRLELATPGLQTQCSSHWAIQLESYCWEGVEFIQLVYCIIIYLSFLNCDWLLIREVHWFYWTQKLLVPVEKFTVRMPKVRLELATPGLQTQCSSHWAIQLESYCWEGVEFIQLVYCIIIYLSFLNCDWLLIREVHWFYWTQKLLVPVEKFTVRMPKVRLELATPGLQTQCSSHWAIQLESYCWEGVEFIQLVYCIIIYLSFLNCDWLLIREVHWFYWTQKLLVPVEKFTVRMPKVRLELATPGLQTQCSSHWAIQLESYCWEGVEFIQLVYCIIIYLSFLNCDWLLIREVHWFYWTQKLLVPVEKFTVRMPKVRLELATPGLQTQCSSHWAIQLESYCWEGVEFIQLVYCIIIYLSFLNCDWLLIREVHWFYWTQKLLVPVEKFTVRMPKVRLELATPL